MHIQGCIITKHSSAAAAAAVPFVTTTPLCIIWWVVHVSFHLLCIQEVGLRLALTANQAKDSQLHALCCVLQVQAIWGARIPVLKYTCALSSFECDISLQGTGALVKAHVIRILNQSCSTLSAVYRLVKLWAQAHDLNDASRSTFNSTSLL